MRVVWDPAKADRNAKKHGVYFVDAATVLDDSNAITIEDKRHDEQRFVKVGRDVLGRILVVVLAYPEATDEIRLISARRATRAERDDYEKAI